MATPAVSLLELLNEDATLVGALSGKVYYLHRPKKEPNTNKFPYAVLSDADVEFQKVDSVSSRHLFSMVATISVFHIVNIPTALYIAVRNAILNLEGMEKDNFIFYGFQDLGMSPRVEADETQAIFSLDYNFIFGMTDKN